MNKKFFTLMAAALATGSVFAQTYDADANFAYRLGQTGYTNIAGNKNPVLDPANGWLKTVTGAPWVKDVKQVEEGLWYQLEVKDGSTPIADVLIQERDTKTGKIYLRVVEKNESGKAPLTASLWKIKYTAEDGVSGGKFTFVNKETGYELSFDQTLAQDANVEYLSKGINEWNWYLNNNGAQVMGWTKLYSVYTDPADASKKLVMTLKKATSTTDNDAINSALKDNGYAVKTTTNVDAAVTSLVAVHIDALPSNPNDVDGLEIKPVVAAPFFMTKEDFNNRLDADGKDFFKFAVEEDVTGAEVLEQEYVAVKSVVADPSTTFGSAYENFNLSFQLKSAPTKYLQIDTKRYEEEKLPSVSPSVGLKADVIPAGASNNIMARAMFRATYYPTNDSLLLEPLHAGIQTDEEYNNQTAFASCKAGQGFTVKGEETSTNSVATIFAWSGALRKRGKLDGIDELVTFADKLEKATIDTIESGTMTKDLALITTLENVNTVNSEDFIKAIRATLENLLNA